MLDGNGHGDHAALGGPEQADILQADRLEGLGGVPGHLADGIGRGKLVPPVKEIDGEAVLKRAECGLDGLGSAHHALDAQARENDQGAAARAEAEIVHGKGLCLYDACLNHHDDSFLQTVRLPRKSPEKPENDYNSPIISHYTSCLSGWQEITLYLMSFRMARENPSDW